MKIGLCQLSGTLGEVDKNLEQMWKRMEQGASAGVDLLIFPELFVTGYNLGERVVAIALSKDSATAGEIARRAARHGVGVLYGYPEREGSTLYNSALLVDGHGNTLANYRKTHLFGDWERRLFEPGGAFVSAELCGLRVGLLICYDLEFPETARRYAAEGVELLLTPTALMAPYGFIARHLVPARATENQNFVAYANRCGEEDGLAYVGASSVCGPDGEVLAQAASSEELVIVELDRERIRRSREVYSYLADRRPEFYANADAPAPRGSAD